METFKASWRGTQPCRGCSHYTASVAIVGIYTVSRSVNGVVDAFRSVLMTSITLSCESPSTAANVEVIRAEKPRSPSSP